MLNKQILILKYGILLALILGTTHAIADTGPHIVVGSGSEATGSTNPVIIPIEYHGDGTVVAMRVDITYDSANLSVDLSNCGASIGDADIFCMTTADPDVVRLVGSDASFSPIADGSLGFLSFSVFGAGVGDYDLLIPAADELYGNDLGQSITSAGSTAGLIQVTAAGGGPQDQVITEFTADPVIGVVGATSTLSATASSSLAVTDFASTTTAVCTVSGATASFLTTGTCTVTADQAGDALFNPALQVTLDIIIEVEPVEPEPDDPLFYDSFEL